MANTRQAERETAQATHDAMRKAEEETGRMASTTARASAQALRAGADLMQRNLETAHQAWQANSQMAAQLIERSMGQFARTTGVSGKETQTATRQVSDGLEGMVQSATVLASGMQSVSREWIEFSQKSLQKSVDDLDALTKCRSAPEVLATQADLFRGYLEHFVQRTRRMAELFVQTAEEAARKTSESDTASSRA
jgi:hypothetical protein